MRSSAAKLQSLFSFNPPFKANSLPNAHACFTCQWCKSEQIPSYTYEIVIESVRLQQIRAKKPLRQQRVCSQTQSCRALSRGPAKKDSLDTLLTTLYRSVLRVFSFCVLSSWSLSRSLLSNAMPSHIASRCAGSATSYGAALCTAHVRCMRQACEKVSCKHYQYVLSKHIQSIIVEVHVLSYPLRKESADCPLPVGDRHLTSEQVKVAGDKVPAVHVSLAWASRKQLRICVNASKNESKTHATVKL